MQFNLVSNWEQRLERNECPVEGCRGELDTGWECTSCGVDFQPWCSDRFKEYREEYHNQEAARTSYEDRKQEMRNHAHNGHFQRICDMRPRRK